MEEVVTLKLETYDKLNSELTYLRRQIDEAGKVHFDLKEKVMNFAIRYIKDNAKPTLKEATVDELIHATDLNAYIYLGDLDYLKLLLGDDDINIKWLLIKIRKEQANEADQ